MSQELDKYIDEYNLQSEKNAESAATDLSKYECSVSKGILSINRVVVVEVGLDKNPYIELYTGKQSGAVIFGMRGGANKDWETAVKVKVLKTKPTKINITRLMLKYRLSTNKDYKIDLIDCGKGFLVFAILTPEPEKTITEPEIKKEEKRYYGSGIVGAQESVLSGSDF